LIREPPQRLDVTRETLARDHGHAGTRGHGFPAEWFAFFDIRYVHLDGGQPGGFEGVVQGDAGVQVGTEIDDEGVDAPVSAWIRSISAPSWADWKKTVEKPRRRASVRMSFSRSLSVARR
jgi:hypothetical protein